jgi:hypothetical protein
LTLLHAKFATAEAKDSSQKLVSGDTIRANVIFSAKSICNEAMAAKRNKRKSEQVNEDHQECSDNFGGMAI